MPVGNWYDRTIEWLFAPRESSSTCADEAVDENMHNRKKINL